MFCLLNEYLQLGDILVKRENFVASCLHKTLQRPVELEVKNDFNQVEISSALILSQKSQPVGRDIGHTFKQIFI